MARLLTLSMVAGLLFGCAAPRPERPWPTGPVERTEQRVQASEPGHRTEVGSQSVALFVGGTKKGGRDGFTIGGEYAYWVATNIGVGGFVDYVAGNIDAVSLGVGVFYHPIERLGLVLMPGVEFARHESAEFLARVGGYYEFVPREGERYVIAPALYADFLSDGKVVLVGGVNFGIKF